MNKKYLVLEPYAIRRRRRAKQLPSLDASKRIDIETHWSVSKKQSLKKQFSNVRPNDDDDDDTDDEISNFNWSGHSNFNWPGHSPGQLKFEIWNLKFERRRHHDDDDDDEISNFNWPGHPNFNWPGHSNFNWPGHLPGQLKFEIWNLKEDVTTTTTTTTTSRRYWFQPPLHPSVLPSSSHPSRHHPSTHVHLSLCPSTRCCWCVNAFLYAQEFASQPARDRCLQFGFSQDQDSNTASKRINYITTNTLNTHVMVNTERSFLKSKRSSSQPS